MTSRVTFGDLASAATRHLEAPARQLPVAGRFGPGVAAAEADEFLAVLPRLLRTIVRYTADIVAEPAAGHGADLASPWARAAVDAHRAARNAYLCLPPGEFTGRAWSHRQETSSLARDIAAAATAITAARDLLHTHSETTADGTRRDRSEWAPVITSARSRKPCWASLPDGHVTSSATASASRPAHGADHA